jgi:LuxR family maltose regulon positive regulatory protein
MDERSIPLLKTKLNMPPQRSNMVLRPRLISKLEGVLQRPQQLILISAKAGSGKTSLVSEWAHRKGQPTAWFSIDANDNDPRRFFSYLLAALQKLDPNIGQVVLSQLESPQLPPVEALVIEIINDLTRSSLSFILALDDYHLIQNESIHQAIAFLTEHQPPGMHLILITRVDPPLSLSRLRGQGKLTEIRGGELRFTTTEAAQYLNEVMDLDLSTKSISTLEERTEGWIVGLHMAAISLQGRKPDGDLSAFIEKFGGTDRFILDYLMEEVLHQQTPIIQDFLIETAILERMSGELCHAVRFGYAESPGNLSGANLQDAAVDQLESQTILDQLERMHLFVVPLDNERRWYRYHHLFADLLKSSLRQKKSAEKIRELHRRAYRWYRDHGFLEEAMAHTMAAQDFEQAAALLDDYYFSMFSRSEVPVLLGWFEKLPEQVVRGRPWFDLYRAYTLALISQTDEAESLLDQVEQRIDSDPHGGSEVLGHIAAIRAYTANLRGDPVRVIEMASLSKENLSEANLIAKGMADYALADMYFATDDLEGADQALLEMLRVGEKKGGLLVIIQALCAMADIKKAKGQLNQAEDLYARAYQWLMELNGLQSRMRCAYEFGLADLQCERNQLNSAHEHVMTGIEYRRRLGGYLMVGDLVLMRVLQAQGDVDGALESLRTAEQFMQTYDFQFGVSIEFNAARVVQWLAVGDVDTANRWSETCRGGSELEQIALARLRLAQGRADSAQRLLDPQREVAESAERTGRLIQILSLQALALNAQGYFNQAESALSQALYLARPEGYRRVFLDLGLPLYKLLQRSTARGTAVKTPAAEGELPRQGYGFDLLEAFQQEGQIQTVYAASSSSGAMIEPLTEREQEVLRLLANGISNKEIASRLVVAPSTVKQHLKNIYGKLDVHNRTQAVARGRELELL